MTDIIKIAAIDAEARVRDMDLAERLGMSDRHQVRNMIARHRTELETHGTVSVVRTETTARGGRPGNAYYLNEGQALVICALSRTPVAAKVRSALIEAFLAFKGKPVAVVSHRRRLPVVAAAPVNDRARLVSFIRSFRDQPEALADWIMKAAGDMRQVADNLTLGNRHIR